MENTTLKKEVSNEEKEHRANIKKFNDQLKYCSLLTMHKILPKLRKDIKKTLNDFNSNSKKDAIMLILSIVDECHFRIGAKPKEISTGMSTMKKQHCIANLTKKEHPTLYFEFIGKSHQKNICEIKNNLISKAMLKMMNYKNDNEYIFMYKNENGDLQRVSSYDVNNLLATYGDVTCKTFRTYHANKYLINQLRSLEVPTTKTGIKKNINKAIEYAAIKLNHTKGVCKKSYILPLLTNLYENDPKTFNIENVNDERALYDILKTNLTCKKIKN